jgi:hypothetical protein
MSVMANRSVAAGAGNAAARERKQKIILGALCGVLALLMVWQVPKLLGGGSDSGSTTELAAGSESAAGATATATATASGTASATATAPATAGAGVVTAKALADAKWIKKLPVRDPFVPLAGEGATAAARADAAATDAAVTSRQAAAAKASKAKAAAVPAAKASSAVIFINGRRQVPKVNQTFKVNGATFKLLAVGPKQAKVSVVIGKAKNGKGDVTLLRNKPVTLENNVTGVQYVLRFTLPLSPVPVNAKAK